MERMESLQLLFTRNLAASLVALSCFCQSFCQNLVRHNLMFALSDLSKQILISLFGNFDLQMGNSTVTEVQIRQQIQPYLDLVRIDLFVQHTQA